MKKKITAILPDELLEQVKKYAGGKNMTQNLTLALQDWLEIQKKIRRYSKEIKKMVF